MNNSIKTLLAAIAVALTVGYLWQPNRAASPRQATWEDVQAEAVAGGYRIITTEKLAQLYAEKPSKLMLIDTRQEWEYRTGHIAGALNFPLDPTRWARWRRAGDLEAFLGPDKNRTLVFY